MTNAEQVRNLLNTHPKYQGKDNNGKSRQEFVAKIAAMTDEKLLDHTEHMIWLSAYAGNNPRSDYHWQVSACYDEWTARDKAEQYTVAYEAAKASAGC